MQWNGVDIGSVISVGLCVEASGVWWCGLCFFSGDQKKRVWEGGGVGCVCVCVLLLQESVLSHVVYTKHVLLAMPRLTY